MEITGHTILSINRYCAIKNVTIKQAFWSKRVTWMFYIILFVGPIIATGYRLFTPAKYSLDKDGVPLISYVNPIVSQAI